MSEARLRLAEAEQELALAECHARAQAVNVHKERFNVEVLRMGGSRSRSSLGSFHGD